MADIFEIGGALRTFATLRLMHAGPWGRHDWTCGWPDGLDLDDLSMQIRRIRRCDGFVRAPHVRHVEIDVLLDPWAAGWTCGWPDWTCGWPDGLIGPLGDKMLTISTRNS